MGRFDLNVISMLPNYADDTTPYAFSNNPEEVVPELEGLTQKLFTWTAQNEMKVKLININAINVCVPLRRLTSRYYRQKFVVHIQKRHWKYSLGSNFW